MDDRKLEKFQILKAQIEKWMSTRWWLRNSVNSPLRIRTAPFNRLCIQFILNGIRMLFEWMTTNRLTMNTISRMRHQPISIDPPKRCLKSETQYAFESHITRQALLIRRVFFQIEKQTVPVFVLPSKLHEEQGKKRRRKKNPPRNRWWILGKQKNESNVHFFLFDFCSKMPTMWVTLKVHGKLQEEGSSHERRHEILNFINFHWVRSRWSVLRSSSSTCSMPGYLTDHAPAESQSIDKRSVFCRCRTMDHIVPVALPSSGTKKTKSILSFSHKVECVVFRQMARDVSTICFILQARSARRSQWFRIQPWLLRNSSFPSRCTSTFESSMFDSSAINFERENHLETINAG